MNTSGQCALIVLHRTTDVPDLMKRVEAWATAGRQGHVRCTDVVVAQQRQWQELFVDWAHPSWAAALLDQAPACDLLHVKESLRRFGVHPRIRRLSQEKLLVAELEAVLAGWRVFS